MSTNINCIGIINGRLMVASHGCTSKGLRDFLNRRDGVSALKVNPNTGIIPVKVEGGKAYLLGGEEQIRTFLLQLDTDTLEEPGVEEIYSMINEYRQGSHDTITWWFTIDW